MILRIIDFQILTLHYKNYRDGSDKITDYKKEFLEKLEPFKTEINEIVKFAESGLIPDRQTQQEKSDRFQELQEQVLGMDSDFKNNMKRMGDELNEKTYDELAVLINAWSIENGVDVAIGKMEIIFNKPEFEATDSILELLKEKELYVE